MTEKVGETTFRICVGVLLFLAVCLAYANTLSNNFVYDDASSVLIHKSVQDPTQFFELFKQDQHHYGVGKGTFYRPLVSVSFMLDFLLSHDGPLPKNSTDLSPVIFHITNAMWHFLAVLFFFLTITRLNAPRFVAAAAALIYAVHPLHTEAVAYISGRADPMAAAFMFAGLFFALSNRRVASILAPGICFAAALLCKEMALIFPVLLILVLVVKPRQEGKFLGTRLLALPLPVLVLATYLALRRYVLVFESDSVGLNTPIAERCGEALQAFSLYLGLIFAPVGLHMERVLPSEPITLGNIDILLATGLLALLVLVAVTVLCWLKGQRRIAAGLTWFLLTWLPISGIFPLNAPMAEHWLYVPLAGFLWAFCETIYAILPNIAVLRRGVAVAVYTFVVLLMALTAHANTDWRDAETFYLATLEENPDTMRVRFNLAIEYEDIQKDLPAAQRQYETIVSHFARLKAEQNLEGQYWDEELLALSGLGRVYFRQGRYNDTFKVLRPVLSIPLTDRHRETIMEATMLFGQCLLATGNREAAQRHFSQVLQQFPELAPHVNDIMTSSP